MANTIFTALTSDRARAIGAVLLVPIAFVVWLWSLGASAKANVFRLLLAGDPEAIYYGWSDLMHGMSLIDRYVVVGSLVLCMALTTACVRLLRGGGFRISGIAFSGIGVVTAVCVGYLSYAAQMTILADGMMTHTLLKMADSRMASDEVENVVDAWRTREKVGQAPLNGSGVPFGISEFKNGIGTVTRSDFPSRHCVDFVQRVRQRQEWYGIVGVSFRGRTLAIERIDERAFKGLGSEEEIAAEECSGAAGEVAGYGDLVVTFAVAATSATAAPMSTGGSR